MYYRNSLTDYEMGTINRQLNQRRNQSQSSGRKRRRKSTQKVILLIIQHTILFKRSLNKITIINFITFFVHEPGEQRTHRKEKKKN